MTNDTLIDEPTFLGATAAEWSWCRRVLIVLFTVALIIGWIRQYSGWV